MKAIRVRAFGGPEQMRLEELPDPLPGPGEALVRHAFIGVNFADISQREGAARGGGTQYETDLPYIPGNEASGVVEALGAGVTALRTGDRVAYRGVFGAYAERAAVPAASLVAVPEAVDLRSAAAALTHGMTAHYVTHDAYPVTPGDWILVHAAAGGTGGLVTQMAKRRGATVVATASSPAKLARARALGADHAIDYAATDFEAECRAIPGFAGFHAVLDNVSAATFEPNLRLLRPLGTLVIFGASSGPVPPFDLQRLNGLGSLAIRRTNMKHYVLTREALERRSAALFAMIAKGELALAVDSQFPLAEAGAAHERIRSRASMGKVLLVP
jgi:NADPH:quinone reductase